MKYLDLDIFRKNAFGIKIQDEIFEITFVPAFLEIEIMKRQVEINEKIQENNITEKDIDDFKGYVKSMISANYPNFDKNVIEVLNYIEVLTLLLTLIRFIVQRSKSMYEAFNDFAIEENDKKKVKTKI